MGLTNFPNGISVQGVQVAPGGGGSGAGSGQSLPATTGKYFYVDSVAGSNANSGTGPTKPLATITAAVAKCRANKGDVIVVMTNHAETITAAAGIVLNKAGITVVGLGQGDNKPAITFTTAVGADVDVTAADITIDNLRFVCNIASQTAMLDVDSTSVRIKNCDFMEGTATGLTMIDINGGAANACDDAIIENCLFLSTTAGNQARAIELGEVADDVIIRNNTIIGDWDHAGIHNPTAKILTNLQITGNIVHHRQTGQHAIELVSACTGSCAYNVFYADTYAATLDPGSLMCVFNRSVNGIDAGSIEIPASADNADNYIGFNNADNGISTSLVVANRDGSVLERVEFLMDEQSGTAGIVTFPAGAQAANAVSMAEVLRYAQEAVRNGTGLALAANKSLVDALGSDGTTVTDVATSVLGAIGANNANNAFASTSVIANDDGSVLERLESLKEPLILQRGTFTTSSATVPADTGRTEANDYWNGCYIVPVAGAILGQPRLITDFANVGGVFTLDTDIPFTAVPGLVAYVITQGNIQIAPTADSTANVTPAHVIGRKTDAVLADTIEGGAATTQSIHALGKSILRRLGADSANNDAATTLVAANRDGSILERIEFIMDELTGTAGIATFPAGAQAANAVSMAEVLRYAQEAVRNGTGLALAVNKSLVDALGSDGATVTDVATSVLGAIGADNANNAFASTLIVANRDGSVLERLEFLMDEQSGTAGITTFPAGAAAANGVSMAEVLRFAQENIVVGAGATLPPNSSLYGVLAGGEGLITFPVGVAAANGVSMAEVLRFAQENIVTGTGSVLPTNSSLYGVLAGSEGIPTFPASAVPGNGVSMAEVLRSTWENTIGMLPLSKDSSNYITVTADFTNVTWNTQASHEIATVTGMVRMTVIPECTGTLVDAADGASIQLGVENSSAALIGPTQAAGAGGNTIETGELWVDTTPADVIATQTTLNTLTFVTAAGKDVGYEITGAALTGGSIKFHIWWTALDSTGLVASGLGGSLI